MRHEHNEPAVIQNLRDAGCNNATIDAFIKDFRENKPAEALKLLAVHRQFLLEQLHKEQKQIDCLDYLVYRIEQAQKAKRINQRKGASDYANHFKSNI